MEVINIKKVSLRVITKYRTYYMALAIVCIMLCHNSLIVTGRWETIRIIVSSFLQFGVDTFMILSGLGLYYSYSKNNSLIVFWKKRFSKILIPYILVVLVYMIIYVGYLKAIPVGQYLWNYSIVSFFTQANLTTWFISAILVLYLAFPLLFNIIEKNITLFISVIGMSIIICFAISFMHLSHTTNIVNEIFVSRIPAFLIGIYIAKLIMNNKKELQIHCFVPMTVFIISTIIIILLLILKPANYWTIVRLLFTPFSISVILITGKLMDWFQSIKFIDRSLIFIGSITLELYLVHEKILTLLGKYDIFFKLSPCKKSIVINIFAIIVSIFISWILHMIVTILTKKINS